MRAVSAFTGIGGFDLGLSRAGIETTCQIEWDAHCQTILMRQFAGVPLKGDIADVSGTDLGIGVELAHGGFPCQDTSIAAPRRAGLAGKRSGHFFEFIRLVGEYARLIEASNPRWVVIENPPGLLRSNGGRDLATVVGHLEDLGYGWAYRVVDGRHLGTPQRRERVLLVGHRGGDPRPAWSVLGDTGDGDQAARAGHPGGQGSGPDTRPIPGGDSLIRVWRKGVRSQVALRFHDHPTCPPKGANDRVPRHDCQGTFNPAYRETWVNDGVANTLTGFDGGAPTRQTHLIAQSGRLRTLTMTEWERLNGFPDGWTEGVPDSARYTALGNAMHVGMAEWLGRRLMHVHNNLNLIGV